MSVTHPYLETDGPVPIAHRGGAKQWPQNTMAAFAGAVGLGYRQLETDVQATSDGVLVLFHDAQLDALSDRSGVIEDMTWSEVSRARVDGEPIPRLEELLDAWDHVRISIDAKSDACTELLITALRRADVLDRVCIGSFSERRLARVNQALGDAVCLSMGPVEIAWLRMLAAAGMRWPAAPRRQRVFRGRCASIPVRQGPVPLATRRLVSYAHSIDLAVHVWTVDEAPEMDRLLDLGVDAIMTDEPETLLGVLRSRGLWPAAADAAQAAQTAAS